MFSISCRALDAGLPRGSYKPVKIRQHHVDRQNVLLLDRAHMRGIAANGQDAARHRLVERLHTAVGIREIRSLPPHPSPARRRRESAGPCPGGARSNAMERCREFQDAGLVGHADKRALNSSHPCTDNRLAR